MLSSDQWRSLIDFLVRPPNVITPLTPWRTGGIVAGTILLIPVLRLTKYLIWRYRSPLKDLRGPEAADNWLWGHLAAVLTNPGCVFEEWIEKYGPTIQFRAFLQAPQLLTIDPRTIAYVVNHNYDFPRPPRLRESLRIIIGQGLLAVEGDDHRRQRRIMDPCFGPAPIRDLMPIFYEKAYGLKSVWTDAVDEKGFVVDVFVGATRVTLDTIGSAGFAYEFNSLVDGEENELYRALMDYFSPVNRPTALDLIRLRVPLLKLIPTQRERVIRNSKEVIDRICAKIFEEKKKAVLAEQGRIDKKRLVGRDIISALVRANLAVDVKESDRMTDQEVTSQISTVLVAGHEATSASLTWMLHELSKPEHIAIQSKLREELLGVANEYPSMEELNALPYLDAVVRETLRFHAVAEYTTQMASKDSVIPVSEPYVDRYGVTRNEIRIAQGEIVILPIIAMNKDPRIWGEDAKKFKPERWLTPEKRVSESPGVYAGIMTFVGGHRGCIGYRVAVMELKVLSFVLLRSFEFTLSDPTLVIEKRSSIVTRPAIKQPDGSYKNTLPLRLTPVSQD